MKLLTLLILISLTLSGCHIERAFDYPDEYKGYYFHGKYPTKGSALAEQTKKDMLDCGFRNTWNNIGYMTKNEVAISSMCMENKGYSKNGETRKTCDYEVYQGTEACQKHLTP